MQGVRQGMLGDGSAIIPSSRTISVASGGNSASATRVISSSRLLSDGGGARSEDGTSNRGSSQLEAQHLTAATDSRRSNRKRVVTGEKLQHGKAESVPPHKRPRRTKAGAGSLAGAA